MRWLPNRLDFPQFHDLDTELDLYWFMNGFPGAFATGAAYQQAGNAYPSEHLVLSPFWGLVLQLLRPECSDAMSLLEFLPWIPLGTFSILHFTSFQEWTMKMLVAGPRWRSSSVRPATVVLAVGWCSPFKKVTTCTWWVSITVTICVISTQPSTVSK